MSLKSLTTGACCAIALSSCSQTDELASGFSVALRASPARAAGTFTTDRGYRVTLTEARVVVAAIEVFSCETTAALWWRQLAGGTAWAHGVASPTRQASPIAIDWLAPAPVELGALHPPPARYCRIRVSIGPADADAHGVSPHDGLIGQSLSITGTWSNDGDTAPHSFSILTSAGAVFERTVSVVATPGPATIALAGAPAAWFEGIVLSSASNTDLAAAVLANLASSVGVTAE